MCLGIKITREPSGGYAFGQQHYLEEILKDLSMQDCKPNTTPMSKGEVNALTAGETGGKKLDANGHALYQQIVGKLMYAMVGSRPDLAYPLSVLGRYGASPDTYHMALAKRVLAYVKATINYRLHYKRGSSSTTVLTGWVDSDYANSDDRKSTTGLCFFINSNLVYWCSKRQQTVATSTTVAEYFALYEATTECVCLRNLLADIGFPQPGPTTIREDNQTAIKLAEDETSHKRTKHIAVKYPTPRSSRTWESPPFTTWLPRRTSLTSSPNPSRGSSIKSSATAWTLSIDIFSLSHP
uniref:Reverse transcriptase Ty1/copia-type domain-containing protein n=1 Tax=Caenorhabditis japonica TaxID=281687 RepID=A0A8R1IP03_CAEJA